MQSMYDHPGEQGKMRYSVRKWKNRPALAIGDTITVIRYQSALSSPNGVTRLLVSYQGIERWINAADVDMCCEAHKISGLDKFIAGKELEYKLGY